MKIRCPDDRCWGSGVGWMGRCPTCSGTGFIDKPDAIVMNASVATVSEPHTPEPWFWLPEEGNFIVNRSDFIIAEVPCQGSNPVDGRRIVACVNACVGVPTEKLESDYVQGYEPYGAVEHMKIERDQARRERDVAIRVLGNGVNVLRAFLEGFPDGVAGNELMTDRYAKALRRRADEALLEIKKAGIQLPSGKQTVADLESTKPNPGEAT
jgi:hypothetical protein